MNRGLFQRLIDSHNDSEEKRQRKKVKDLKEQIEQNEEIQKFSKKLKKKGNNVKTKRKKRHWSGYSKGKAKGTIILYIALTIFISIKMNSGEVTLSTKMLGQTSYTTLTGGEVYTIGTAFILFFIGHTIWMIKNYKHFR